MAALAIDAIGWWMVVTSGQTMVEAEVSSKPTTERSRGTSSPRRCATEIAAAAMSSLPAKIALGGLRLERIFSAAFNPERCSRPAAPARRRPRGPPRSAARNRRSGALPQVGTAADEADAVVALFDEMLGQFLAGAEVVDPHAGDVVAETARGDEDDRVPARTIRSPRCAIRTAAAADHAAASARAPRACVRPPRRGRPVVAGPPAVRAGTHRWGRVDQRDPRVLRGGERAGGEVRRVVELAPRA